MRNGHVSRKCTGWDCEGVSCFTFWVLQIQSGHLLRAEKLLSSYLTPHSHEDGQSSALVATQPQEDAMRPLSCLPTCVSQPCSSGSQKLPRGVWLSQTVWTIQLLCLPFLYSYTRAGVIWMPQTIPGYTVISLMKIRNKYHTVWCSCFLTWSLCLPWEWG